MNISTSLLMGVTNNYHYCIGDPICPFFFFFYKSASIRHDYKGSSDGLTSVESVETSIDLFWLYV